ncbi:MAG TPA: hypothetical protein V6C52_11085 [Coleofasciculaceae cyanobacterium]|jgi:hypothetical protein
MEDFLTRLKSDRNRLEFALRNFVRLPVPAYQEPNETKDNLLTGDPEALKKAETLHRCYDLSRLYRSATRQRTLETLSCLEWLDHLASVEPGWFERAFQAEQFRWLDVGAKNWAYVEALQAFIRARTDAPFRLDGVELDPNRRYTDFRTRRQYAERFIQPIPEARYHAGNILSWQQPAAIISHFLPFVFRDPLLDWGLPEKCFQPQAILNHLLSLLPPGGLLLIVNQGEEEAREQEALFQTAAGQLPLRWKSLGQLPASFIEYRYSRYGWLCGHDDRTDTDYHAGNPKPG